MKNIKTPIIVSLLFLMLGCKRDHTCVCDDPRADVAGFVIHDTKKNATKQCEATKNTLNDSKCYISDDKKSIFRK